MDPNLPRTVTNPGAWRPGCEVLEKGYNLKQEDEERLKRCIRAIQLPITEGSRNSKGRLDIDKVFINVFSRLKPEEQDLAGKVFIQYFSGPIKNYLLKASKK